MIRCSKCGYVGPYHGPECPSCKEGFNLTSAEIYEKMEELRQAESLRQYELVAEVHHILADLGRRDSQRIYASMLEKGEGVVRDIDAAMEYYYMAAENNDFYSAYKYALLVERLNEKASRFWLAYSAVHCCAEAYPVLADRLARDGDDAIANFYYARAASYDDINSIVVLAKRYYQGIGTEQNLPYAKWYMDKLRLPPIHAIKMAYKLRSVKAEDPGKIDHPDFKAMLRRLAINAKDYGYDKPHFELLRMLSDFGDMNARIAMAELAAEGKGHKKDLDMAISLLRSAGKAGSSEAYSKLGEMYLTGKHVEVDINNAISYYRLAAEMGMTNAYETIGDIFHKGELVPRDIEKAIALYDVAAKEGHTSAREKSEALKNKREELFELGMRLKDHDPVQSFRALAISSGMGYVPAYKEMAHAFLEGRGVKKNRPQAFLWYEKAVNSKDDSALYEYGLCFSRGIGTAFSFKKAKDVLAKATRLGSQEARAELERLLINRHKTMQNKCYSRAMRLIHQKKFADAVELLGICHKLGNAKGIYTLACLYEFGLGITANRGVAFRLYEESFDRGFRDPRAVYKLRILRMVKSYR